VNVVIATLVQITRGAISIFKTPQRLFQHSKHQIFYSNIQNTIELIPTFKTSERLFQLSKHHRGYSNFQNTTEAIPTFKTPESYSNIHNIREVMF
jgi:hypothetical protein